MGTGFPNRLLAQGFRVIGYDTDAERCRMAQARGLDIAINPAAVGAGADILAICVTTTKAVQAVVLGPEGLLSLPSLAGKTIIDFSTTDIAATKAVASALAEKGAAFVDAPVSGGPAAAEAGSLALMAGGSEAAMAGVSDLLALFGQVTHMGPVGAGQATKLVNQALCLTNYCVVAESLRLAQAYGVDAAKVPDALAPGLAHSAVLQTVYRRMVAEDFAPRGYARQVLKDLEMLHEATRDLHLAMPMASQALTMFRTLIAEGKGELDGAAVVTLLPDPSRQAG